MQRNPRKETANIDTTNIEPPGLQQKSIHVRVDYDTSKYNERIINQLFNLPDGTATQPFVSHNSVSILQREEGVGQHTIAFRKVKEAIRKTLMQNRQSQELQMYLAAAKRKYKLITHFTPADYAVN